MRWRAVICFVFGFLAVYGQDKKTQDSLISLIRKASHDTVKLRLEVELEESRMNMRAGYWDSLAIRAGRINFLRVQAHAINNVGYIHQLEGDIKQAIEYYNRALKIHGRINDLIGEASVLNNLGTVYSEQGDVKKALEYYQKSILIQEKAGDKYGVAGSLNNIASVYHREGNMEMARRFFEKSMAIREEIGDKLGVAQCLNNIGFLYDQSREAEKAKDYYSRSLAQYKELDDKGGMVSALINLGYVHFDHGDAQKSLEYATRAMETAKEIGYPQSIKSAASLLNKVYRATGDFRNALVYYELFMVMRDSINNQENQKAALRQQIQYEYERKEQELKAENEKKEVLAKAEKKRQSVLVYSVTAVLVLVAIFSMILFNRLKLTRTQKQVIEEKNKEITDSIKYAKRIQEAVLKEEGRVSENLPDHFVLYRPKDIVSGDFYWSQEKQGYWYLCVADCTGHGVPGAFMSLLGIAYLNEINAGAQILEPQEIVEGLRDKVIRELSSKGFEGQYREGMDISLVRFNAKTGELLFCGAHNDLLVVREGKLFELKADKQPVGFQEGQTPFTRHAVHLSKGDVFYLSSDGYADQFGGADAIRTGGKKFKKANLKKLLERISALDLESQKQQLNDTFENWRGNLEQLDDVCVIGVKVS